MKINPKGVEVVISSSKIRYSKAIHNPLSSLTKPSIVVISSSKIRYSKAIHNKCLPLRPFGTVVISSSKIRYSKAIHNGAFVYLVYDDVVISSSKIRLQFHDEIVQKVPYQPEDNHEYSGLPCYKKGRDDSDEMSKYCCIDSFFRQFHT